MSLVTDSGFAADALSTGSTATPGDYVELLKPRVMSLVVFTALCGIVAAPIRINPVLAFTSLLAIAVGAGASGALNMAYDADIDGLMARTRGRPIPSGRVTAGEALAFGGVLSLFSVMVIGLAANWLAAALLGFTILFYSVVYTIYLKRRTPQNIVIGGAAGALPPLIGYAAVTGTVTLDSLLLFGIIFIWTPPHFWALALLRSEDYARAGVPMMPNVKGTARTRLEILVYSAMLAPLGIVPWFTRLGGNVYGVVALVAGGLFLLLAWRCYRRREGSAADKAAKHLFGFSILYLFLLFAVLLAERGLALATHFGLWG
ncbi:MAG TPA: heme o synthase [Lichenihabitans sp.]|jgi:protoheme IX farnesyltransferase|nr:heme o synthase [Lichenihabitans sp.]